MAIRLEVFYIPSADILVEAKSGKYKVVVFQHYTGSICYSVLLNGQKVRCWTSEDERTFPERPAIIGSELVKIYTQQQGLSLC